MMVSPTETAPAEAVTSKYRCTSPSIAWLPPRSQAGPRGAPGYCPSSLGSNRQILTDAELYRLGISPESGRWETSNVRIGRYLNTQLASGEVRKDPRADRSVRRLKKSSCR